MKRRSRSRRVSSSGGIRASPGQRAAAVAGRRATLKAWTRRRDRAAAWESSAEKSNATTSMPDCLTGGMPCRAAASPLLALARAARLLDERVRDFELVVEVAVVGDRYEVLP